MCYIRAGIACPYVAIFKPSIYLFNLIILYFLLTEGKNQALVGVLPFCGEYPGPRSEDKFRSSNQMDGISIANGGKMADS